MNVNVWSTAVSTLVSSPVTATKKSLSVSALVVETDVSPLPVQAPNDKATKLALVTL